MSHFISGTLDGQTTTGPTCSTAGLEEPEDLEEVDEADETVGGGEQIEIEFAIII